MTMKRIVLPSLCALSLLTSNTQAAQLSPPQPSDVTSKVDAIFKDFTGQPGCNVGVVRSGKLILERSYGLADIANDLRLNPETRFDIGSMSKQFTAAAVLILADQGKIGLDDDIHKYVPELPNYGVKVSLRQMLHMTSGIMDEYELLKLAGWVYGDAVSEHDALWALTRMPKLNFAPGTRESYSGGNYVLLALVVERVSGQPFRAYLQSTIFGPLGMTHTVLTGDHTAVVPHEARAYAVVDGRPHLMELRGDAVGAGGIITTVGDLALWEHNFDDPRVGGAKVMAEMQTVEPLADGSPNDYAFGLMIRTYRRLRTVEHDGGNGGFISDKIRFPSVGLTFIELCNHRDPADEFRKLHQVADLYLGLAPEAPRPAIAGAATPMWPANDLPTLAGPYLNVDRWQFHIFTVENGGLVDEEGTRYTRTGRYEFKDARGETWHFAVENGVATAVERQAADSTAPPMRYARMPPPRSDLSEYAGMYVSPELATTWCVEAMNKGLVLHRKRFEDEAVEPGWLDVFGMEGPAFFDRVNNQITGFTMRVDRLEGGVRFVKEKHEGACTPY
jgi:CubicO group peptidase (beta-lactamase class C family)